MPFSEQSGIIYTCAVAGKFYSSCISKGKWTAWWGRQDIASLPEQWGHSLPEPLTYGICKHWDLGAHVLQFQFSRSVMSDSLWPHGLQHARLPCPSPTPRGCTNSYPLSQWCHPTISSSVVPFFSCFCSFPASGSFPRGQFFESCGQSTEVSTWASVLPMTIQDWFPLGLTGWISFQSKGLTRVFSNTTVQKHQFFGSQLSL